MSKLYFVQDWWDWISQTNGPNVLIFRGKDLPKTGNKISPSRRSAMSFALLPVEV